MRALPLALLVFALAACGGDDQAAEKTAEKPAEKPAEPPPAELLGTYTTRLQRADIPRPVPDLLDGEYRWTLRITKDGGPDNAPALTIVHPPDDVLESSAMAVTGDTIKLMREECEKPSGGYDLVSSSYRWKVDGGQLRLTPVVNGCPDKIALTILSSGPWTRSG